MAFNKLTKGTYAEPKVEMERPESDLPNRVFVYGSLKTGQFNHNGMVEGENGVARYVGQAQTRTAYPLVVFTQWNVPFLLHVPGKGQIISGEVYDVDDQCFKWLDKLEHYPELYARERITVDLLPNVVTGSVLNGTLSNNLVSDDPVSTDVIGRAKPGQVTCWVYFLKNFTPEMLQLEMYSCYNSIEIQLPFKKTDGEKLLEEVRNIVEGSQPL